VSIESLDFLKKRRYNYILYSLFSILKNMEIKDIVKEIVKNKSRERIFFIEEYIKNLNVDFNILDYGKGKNIEFVKQSKNNDKDIIFFAHHDISKDTKEGANDNSSSVAVLLNTIKYLKNIEVDYNVRLVFNDKEEILGALLNKNLDAQNISKIISNVGSFQYLKNFSKKENIIAVFNVELSGIGDIIYFATKSGLVTCDSKLINYMEYVCKKEKIEYAKIPVLNSDMISVHTLSKKGAVYGSIPNGDIDILSKNPEGVIRDLIPSVWKNIHSLRDNIFAIQEKSLFNVYNFTTKLIDNLGELKSFL